jgi:hypothetical protein
MPYASVAEFRANFPQVPAGAADDALIAEKLAAATAIIDQRVGFSFGAAAAAPKLIYGDGTGYLALPPYVAGSITAITAPDGYSVPGYAERDGLLVATDAAGVAYQPGGTGISSYASSTWREGVPYTVAATFGYATVPADIKEACLEIAGRLWQGRNSGYSDVIGVEGANAVGYQKALPALVKAILDSYKERSSLGVW